MADVNKTTSGAPSLPFMTTYSFLPKMARCYADGFLMVLAVFPNWESFRRRCFCKARAEQVGAVEVSCVMSSEISLEGCRVSCCDEVLQKAMRYESLASMIELDGVERWMRRGGGKGKVKEREKRKMMTRGSIYLRF